MDAIDKVLSKNGMKETSIDKVVLVGGGSNMPKIQQLIRDKFSSSEVLTNIQPSEVLAEEAARQAAILLGRDNRDVVPIDCISRNIGFQTISSAGNPQLQIVIEKNTPVP